jgi:hypothetical protein
MKNDDLEVDGVYSVHIDDDDSDREEAA